LNFSKTAASISRIEKDVFWSRLCTNWAYSKSLGPEVNSAQLVLPGLIWIIGLSAALAE